MKTYFKEVGVLTMIVGMLVALAVGCGGPTPTPTDPAAAAAQHEQNVTKLANTIKVSANSAASIGLNEWAKKEPDAAKEAATALSKNIHEVLAPYFANAAALPSSAEVQAFLNSSLMKDVNPTLKSAVIAASAVLDMSLPVPSADKIDPDAVKYIQAFLDGLSGACDAFIGGAKAVKGPPTVWLK